MKESSGLIERQSFSRQKRNDVRSALAQDARRP